MAPKARTNGSLADYATDHLTDTELEAVRLVKAHMKANPNDGPRDACKACKVQMGDWMSARRKQGYRRERPDVHDVASTGEAFSFSMSEFKERRASENDAMHAERAAIDAAIRASNTIQTPPKQPAEEPRIKRKYTRKVEAAVAGVTAAAAEVLKSPALFEEAMAATAAKVPQPAAPMAAEAIAQPMVLPSGDGNVTALYLKGPATEVLAILREMMHR